MSTLCGNDQQTWLNPLQAASATVGLGLRQVSCVEFDLPSSVAIPQSALKRWVPSPCPPVLYLTPPRHSSVSPVTTSADVLGQLSMPCHRDLHSDSSLPNSALHHRAHSLNGSIVASLVLSWTAPKSPHLNHTPQNLVCQVPSEDWELLRSSPSMFTRCMICSISHHY